MLEGRQNVLRQFVPRFQRDHGLKLMFGRLEVAQHQVMVGQEKPRARLLGVLGDVVLRSLQLLPVDVGEE